MSDINVRVLNNHKIKAGLLFLCFSSLALGTKPEFTTCLTTLLEEAPEVLVQRLLNSSLAERYRRVGKTHQITGHLLVNIRPYLSTFYGYASLPDEKWDASTVSRAVESINSWFSPSADNSSESVGQFASTLYGVELLQRLGISKETFEPWAPPAPNAQGWVVDGWREERRNGQIATLNSFFWSDHGIEHVKDMLARSFDLASIISPGHEERYAFLLDPGQEGALWRIRLRQAALLHDLSATSYRKEHPYLACGSAHQVVGEMSHTGYVPVFNQPRGDFKHECSVVGVLALLHSKSAISTDDLPQFRKILEERTATNHARMFRERGADERPFFSMPEVALATVGLPVLTPEDDERMVRTAEILRLLDGFRPKGVASKANPNGMVNSAGYPFELGPNGMVLVSVTDFTFRPIAVYAPDYEQHALYGQLAVGTPGMRRAENGAVELVFSVLNGGAERAKQLKAITGAQEFRAVLRQKTYQNSDLAALSSDKKLQSILNAILDLAFEFPSVIRNEIQFSFI